MKFNPLTNTLYTDDNKLVKKMYCPYSSLKWDNFSSINESMSRFCDICESSVVETKNMSDATLLDIMGKNPETCLKIDFSQENIRITHDV